MQPKELSIGERLLLTRRRLGETQADAAARHGISTYRYRQAENGQNDAELRAPRVGRVHPFEECLILRRRANVTLSDLAAYLRVSRTSLIEVEAGRADPTTLYQYWQGAKPKERRN